jgi:hypothetical protein
MSLRRTISVAVETFSGQIWARFSCQGNANHHRSWDSVFLGYDAESWVNGGRSSKKRSVLSPWIESPRHSTVEEEDTRLPKTSGFHYPWRNVVSKNIYSSATVLQKFQISLYRSCLAVSNVKFNDSKNLSATALEQENSWEHRTK